MRLAAPQPGGVFQIRVPEGARLDVFAGGEALSPLAFTGVHACRGVRKSLRFRPPPSPGEATLVVTDAAKSGFGFVIDPVTP